MYQRIREWSSISAPSGSVYTQGVGRAKTPRRGRARLGRQTFTSAAEAASTFYTANELFFDHVADPIDGLRAWADGQDAMRGRVGKRLSQSAAGRKIFDARQGRPQILAALRWVFQQSKGRRWDAVDWSAIDDLGEALAPLYEPPDREPGTLGIYWRPTAHLPLAERIADIDPHDALQLGAIETAEALASAVAELRETYEVSRECLSPRLRAIVERRIDEWTAWVRDPSRIPAYACEPDEATQGYVCNYPLVLGELRELRGACRQAYDPDWYERESDAGAPGFPPAPGDPRGPAPTPNGAPAGERPDVEALPEVPTELGLAACPSEELRQLQTDGRAYGGALRTVAETRTVGDVFYQSEYRFTNRGTRRGPYWYAYWRDAESGRRRSRYVGLKFETVTPKASRRRQTTAK